MQAFAPHASRDFPQAMNSRSSSTWAVNMTLTLTDTVNGRMEGWVSGWMVDGGGSGGGTGEQVSEVLLSLFNMLEMSSWTPSLELGHYESRWWASQLRTPLLQGGNSSRPGSQHARSPRAQPWSREGLAEGLVWVGGGTDHPGPQAGGRELGSLF